VNGGLRLQAMLARRAARRLVQMARCRRIGLRGVPVLFANSFPKSGTHLLTQVLAGFSRIGPAVDSGLPAIVTFEGDTGKRREQDQILADLERLLPGDIAYGHLHALPEICAWLSREGVAGYLILRDPRDVVVSHVHYVTEMEPRHAHHRYYTESLHSFSERLAASIRGFDGPLGLPDIRSRFEPFLGWLQQPEVLVLKYEDLVHSPEAGLERVIAHAERRGFPLSCSHQEAMQILAQGIEPRRSPTFRSGKAGGWRECFTHHHKQLFLQAAGDLLITLGYEQDHDW